MLKKSVIALLCGIGIAAAAFAAGPKPVADAQGLELNR
jgi:hypothetical protein